MRYAIIPLLMSAILHVLGFTLAGFASESLFLIFPVILYSLLSVGLLRDMAQDPEACVLLTTFNARLAEALARKLPLLASEQVCARIHVAALGDVIRDLHAQTFGPSELVSEDKLTELLTRAIDKTAAPLSVHFLRDEWSLIVDAWNVRDWDSYRDLPRLGRKVRLPSARREAAWVVFEALRAALDAKNLKTEAQLAHDLTDSGKFHFTHAVIDEAQDVSVAELMLLGHALGKVENGLFFAGDIGQRIFRAPFPWAATGVEIRGRSRSLKVAEVDPARQRIRLDFGPAHGSDGRFLSPWVPYAQFSGALKIHTPPTLGQQFTAMSPTGDFQQAVAVPLTHHEGNPSPSSAGDQNVVTYGKVTVTLADDLVRSEVGGLTLELTGAAAKITVGSVTFKVSGAGVEITGGMVTHNGTNIGDIHTHTDTPGLGAGTTSPPN